MLMLVLMLLLLIAGVALLLLLAEAGPWAAAEVDTELTETSAMTDAQGIAIR